ncbi:MAG: glycosyltransferase [bacterium]
MKISIIIVVRNGRFTILNCIKSIESQFQEKDNTWELIIIDGLSEDHTKDVATNYLKEKKYSWVILDNPKKNLAPGWNIGIKAAKGTYVVRPDVHSILHKGYVEYGIQLLEQKNDVSVVGGAIKTKASGFWGEIIAQALSSKVGVGGSPFRTQTKDGRVDTVAYGIYRKEIFDRVGFFNETLVRHQDNHMHDQIQKAGGTFYLYNKMKADYLCRNSCKKVAKQMFQNGYYLPRLSLTSLKFRHVIPLVFFMGLLLIWLMTEIIRIGQFLPELILGSYLTIIALSGMQISIEKKNIKYIFTGIIILIMHLSYAAGMLAGTVYNLMCKKITEPKKEYSGLN